MYSYLVAAFVSGFIIDAFHNDVSSMLFIGGIATFIAAFTVLFVETEYRHAMDNDVVYQIVPIDRVDADYDDGMDGELTVEETDTLFSPRSDGEYVDIDEQVAL